MQLSKQQLKEIAIKAIDEHRGKIIAIGDSIFEEPELGYKEFKTADKVKAVFEGLGIPVRDKVALTGVIGSLKGASSKAKIAVMGELDAVVSTTHRCSDPATGAAHACGHNCMIAALAGVAYALAGTDVMKHLDGDVELIAVPAEEYVEIEYRKQLIDEGKIKFLGGKQELVYLGELDAVDMVIMEHNDSGRVEGKIACAGYGSNGFVGKLVRYIGKAAHAGGSPHLGVNALNAANIGLMAVSCQRETFRDKDCIRVHPIITKGGDLVNVIPDDVRIETYIRGNNIDAILDAEFKVDRAFKAGADAVGAACDIQTFPGYLPMIPCEPLMDLLYANQVEILGEDNVMYSAGPMAGSTDAGDLSYLMPMLHGGFSGMSGTLHGNDVEISDKDIAYIASAKCLAMTVIDLLYDGASSALHVKEQFTPLMTKEQYLKEWGKLDV
ncbi:MAG: amidohydrolase [Defluviitaleaceae bacterium]|nr:amidohydrolase [Defluviitaleaceae bacterium]